MPPLLKITQALPSALDKPMAQKGKARAIAATIFMRAQSGKGLEQALTSLAPLKGHERSFAAAIALCAIRHHYLIERHAARFMARPLPKGARAARALLNIGAAQILYMDVPAHAAIDETIAAARPLRSDGHRRFLNAVLRKIAQEPRDETIDAAPQNALPDWLAQSWQAAFGTKTTDAIIRKHLTPPPLDLHFKTSEARTRFQEKFEKSCTPLTATMLRLPETGDITHLPYFAQGDWWVQDIAATIAVRALAIEPGTPVLDLCAAPGGKSLQLANSGAVVTAIDHNEERLERLRANMERTKLSATIIAADILNWQSPQKWQHILLDAPCSATGTLRRNPDILLTRNPDDVHTTAAMQKALLARAATFLAAGGHLLYCVCSLQPEEGEAQIADFLAAHSDFALAPLAPGTLPQDFKGFKGFTPSHTTQTGTLTGALTGTLRITPADFNLSASGEIAGGCDGFFIAHLRKSA